MPASKKDRERYFTISVVSQMLGIHQQTLRIYEKEGLIKPTRTQGNTRLYSEQDIERIQLILRFTTELGVNLAGVGVILEMREQMENLEKLFEKRMQQVVEELTQCFMNYLQDNSSLPVVSYKKGLIIRQEGIINKSR